jgi:hypothetical protein
MAIDQHCFAVGTIGAIWLFEILLCKKQIRSGIKYKRQPMAALCTFLLPKLIK